jgi:hypothetical protein
MALLVKAPFLVTSAETHVGKALGFGARFLGQTGIPIAESKSKQVARIILTTHP